MELDELTTWIEANTPAFEYQAQQDLFFDEILDGFQTSTDAPQGEIICRLEDYDGFGLDVVLGPNGRFSVWWEERRLVNEYADLCAVNRAHEEHLQRHWSSVLISDEWKQKWETCGHEDNSDGR